VSQIVEKALRGLSIDEMVQLINRCCTDGVRSPTYINDRGQLGNFVLWTYETLGITVKFEYYAYGMQPSFKLFGADWAITFKARRNVYGNEGMEFTELRLGPLEVGTRRIPAVPVLLHCHGFRRRGTLDKYRRDLTLLRLTL